jgi:RNA polymerase sigma factor (sigma-70 family)
LPHLFLHPLPAIGENCGTGRAVGGTTWGNHPKAEKGRSMTIRRVEDVAPQICSLLAIGSVSGVTDGQLLDLFARGNPEASNFAFEALVERHGPMVLRVCRGVLREPHDSEDAFQATFLVLVRRAGSIRDRDSLASWLHGVALRVASHARAKVARRRRLERTAVERVEFSPVKEADDDLGPRLHEEVGRLPERYRAAVVLCYLEGHTCEDAARVLNWPVGTVKSRLSRARERLRSRLTRLDPPLALPALSPRLARSTAELAGRFGAGLSAPASSLGAVSLAEGVLKVMTLAKWKYPAIALLAAASWLGVSSALAPARAIQDERKTESRKEVEPKPQAQDPAPDLLARTVPRDLEVHAGSGTGLMYALDSGTRVRIADGAEAKAGARLETIRTIAKTIEKHAKDLEAVSALPGHADALRTLMMAIKKDGQDLEKALAPPSSPEGPWKEADVPLRWVGITGVIDNQGVREALTLARKIELAEAYPNYKRLEVQRQVRRPGENWSDWRDVDHNKNYEVLDNLPQLSPERMPDEVRPAALVDPLPFLKKGTWSGVDPESILRLPKPSPNKFAADNKRPYQSPLLAIRSLDFTVEPGTTYRYRVRVLLVNPDKANDGQKELLGSWSEPTKEVAVP